ncbi:hypothetical protein CBM2591_U10020 [Cupriavidus taiwanensis]|nr:hypothetical protein CBM2591_U10020 [Cupriavidus taiwanensis]
MAQRDARARRRRIGLQDRKQPPAALRQPLQVMLEHGHPADVVQPCLLVAPVVGGLVAGLVEDLFVRLAAERLFDGDVVVREEVARHVKHRQRVGGPDTGFGINVDWQLRLHRGNSVRKGKPLDRCAEAASPASARVSRAPVPLVVI